MYVRLNKPSRSRFFENAIHVWEPGMRNRTHWMRWTGWALDADRTQDPDPAFPHAAIVRSSRFVYCVCTARRDGGIGAKGACLSNTPFALLDFTSLHFTSLCSAHVVIRARARAAGKSE